MTAQPAASEDTLAATYVEVAEQRTDRDDQTVGDGVPVTATVA